MLELTASDVHLNGVASTKEEAIQVIVKAMVSANLVEPDYLDGMLLRETQTSTYLGNGIAIPHGTPETRTLVKQTGVQIVRFPNGIDWGNGETTYTAIGIAAKSDEHLSILRQLTHVITDDQRSEHLHSAPTSDEVISILNGQPAKPSFEMNPDNIRLASNIRSLEEAKLLTASMLYNSGYCDNHQREELVNVEPLEFGQGLWISTAYTEDFQTGIAVVASQEDLDVQGAPFKMLLSLTSNGTSHKPLFDRLLQLKRDDALVSLTEVASPQSLITALSATAIEGESIEIRLPIEHGLHARPAAQLAKLIKTLGGEIWVENLDSSEPPVKGDSVARLINLAIQHGQLIRFTVANCKSPNEALMAISKHVSEGLGDPVVPVAIDHNTNNLSTQNESEPAIPSMQLSAGDQVTGLCGAPGITTGQTIKKVAVQFQFDKHSDNPSEQTTEFNAAQQTLINSLSEKLKSHQGTASEEILRMHLELIQDPELLETTLETIATGKTAAWAWTATYQKQIDILSKNNDPRLAERADDYRDIGYQLMLILTNQHQQAASEPHILICDELNPSEVAEFNPDIVKAIVTCKGGTTSHAAILARAAGIPLLVGCGDSVLTIPDNSYVIVDCDNRSLKLVSSSDELAAAELEIKRRKELQEKAYEHRFEPAISRDGVEIEVVSNISSAANVMGAMEQGSEGVGLFRSEFLYMAHASEPTHEQQVAEYKAALAAMNDDKKPLIVRTLDVGGDKPLPYLSMAEEENPFLGVRGARLSLMYPDMLKRQLAALLEAADKGLLKIMFPMVSDIQEWRQIKSIYSEVKSQYPDVEVEIGMMIEVPSAALMAEVFAPELDFFSIGTNDLTQYTLAVDRGHPVLSKQADPMHPAILRLIKTTVDAARQYGIWVGVCGELAADPFAAKLLLGLGVKELSMSSKAIPIVKAAVRETDFKTATQVAALALKAESAEAVHKLKEVGL